MYFLPAFLAHYRRLGVKRFVFLNDRSDDGSLEYLTQQPDTVVVEGGRSYGDTVEVPTFLSTTISHPRVLYLWRAMLHDMFAQERWALQVDLDEFIRLPEGMTFPDLVAHLERQNARSVWGVMLDVYPKNIATLAKHEKTDRLDMSAMWYFDGEQHLRLRHERPPKNIYPGARARLYWTYGIEKLYPVLDTEKPNLVDRLVRKRWFRRRPLRYNVISKPSLLRWRHNSYFLSCHNTNLSASPHYLLPIQHFRFAGSLYHKIAIGIAREILTTMDRSDHRLLRNSGIAPYHGGTATVLFFTENPGHSGLSRIFPRHATRVVF